MSSVECLEKDKATALIQELREKRRELHDNCRVDQWLHDTDVTCFILSENGRVLSFALLTAWTDPLGRHPKGKFLQYFYTVESQRNRGLATSLLRTIRRQCQVLCASLPDDEDQETSEDAGGEPGDGYVVGILPALLTVPAGTIRTVGNWVENVLLLLAKGATLPKLLKSTTNMLYGLVDTVDVGVDDLEDTVEEPVTSLGLEELPEDLGLT